MGVSRMTKQRLTGECNKQSTVYYTIEVLASFVFSSSISLYASSLASIPTKTASFSSIRRRIVSLFFFAVSLTSSS